MEGRPVTAFAHTATRQEAGATLAIVNVGPTRADGLADFKVEALAGEVMMLLANHPRLLLPRV
jgi:NAD-dependent SIR2 family protein deacetylase